MADVTEHHVNAVSSALHKGHSGKLGPLPVWAWGAVLGLGVAAWLYFHNRAAASKTTDTNPSAATATGDQVYPDLTANNLGSAGNQSSGGNGSASADTTSPTNQDWITRGVAYMITQGRNPITTQQALDKYIAGAELTWNEDNNYVVPVVTKFGLPPQGVDADSKIDPKPAPPSTAPPPDHKPPTTGPPKPPVKTTPKPLPKPKTKTVYVTEWKHYTIKWGDTLSGLAAHYHTSVSELAAKNHIANPNKIYAHHSLLVPVRVKKTVPA